jgi:transcriptional regulator with GAF, ATPase, and Fis domain
LFLDEIGDLSAFTQAKLLRVLQEKSIQRVGGKETIPVDARIIAATHRDLERAIGERQFREDLFYRLSSFVIPLPPLRDRLEDIPELARYFLRRFARELELSSAAIQPEAILWLQQQTWPGNVRQLANVIRQALLFSRGFPISADNLKAVTARKTNAGGHSSHSLTAFLDEFLDAARQGALADAHAAVIEAVERQLFARAIELAQGNQAKAARWLNVSRQTMREKLTHFGLRPPGDGASGKDGASK